MKKVKKKSELKKVYVELGSRKNGKSVRRMSEKMGCSESNVMQHISQIRRFGFKGFVEKGRFYLEKIK